MSLKNWKLKKETTKKNKMKIGGRESKKEKIEDVKNKVNKK
ncbi:hypothetical protein [Clostridium septicum]